MRTLFTWLFCFITFLACTQKDLAPSAWQEDLRFLQNTIHRDYPFLFKKITAEKFDAEVEKFYQAIPNLEDHEVIVGLARMVALFEYGHTGLSLNAWYRGDMLGVKQMPFHAMAFKDGIFIQGVHRDYRKALGAKIITIAGQPVEAVLQAVKTAFPSENDPYFRAYGLHLLGNPAVLHAQGVTKGLQNTLSLGLEKDGVTFEMVFNEIATQGFPGRYGFVQQNDEWLDARDQTKTPLWLDNLDKIYYSKYLAEEKTLYVRHSQIQDDPAEKIPEFYSKVFEFIKKNEVEKLVLDFRLNGGGNNYKNKPIVTGAIQTEQINQPGKFFVLISGRTYSACQNLVNELDNYTHAIFVGEPTGENINFYGDSRPVELPNSKLSPRLSFAWWQDKPQWENGPWLAPQLTIESTFAEYQSNQDPVLEAVLKFEELEESVKNPIAYLETLFKTGDMEKVASEARRLVKDPRFKYLDFEDRINRAGYNLLNGKQFDAAMLVFQLNTEFFPNSPNAWDSLAEVHWKSGKTEKAEELYRKVIAMDPEGAAGVNARQMLKAMKEDH